MRWHSLKGVRNLLLPRQAVLAVDLRTRLEVLHTLVEQSCPQNNVVWAEGFLGVVHMGGAVLAVVLRSIRMKNRPAVIEREYDVRS